MYAYLLLKADDRGKPKTVLSDLKDFTLDELHIAIDCDCIEIVRVRNPIDGSTLCMVIDESGKVKRKRINLRASLLYGSVYDYIAGDALICKEAMTEDGPDLVKMIQEDTEELEQILSGSCIKYRKELPMNREEFRKFLEKS